MSTRLQREFNEFDKANPNVWKLFKRFAFQALQRGYTRFSVSSIYERIRWEVKMTTLSNDDFKINNNHRAYYARKWNAKYPHLAKFFEIRTVRGERNGQGDLFE